MRISINTLIAPAAEAEAPGTVPKAEAQQESIPWTMLLCLAFGIAVGMYMSRKRQK